MSMAEALRRCPQAVLLPVDGQKYRLVSLQIRGIFLTYTPMVEPLSLDEAFLDVTASTGLFGSAEAIAFTIKERIQQELETVLLELACDVGQSLRKEKLKGKTVTLKARYDDFRTLSRSRTLPQGTNVDDVIYREARSLLREISLKQPLRLIGVSLHNLTGQDEGQLSLFAESQQNKEKLANVIDLVKEKYGEQSITRARLLKRKE